MLPKELYEVGEQVQSPDDIIVRSADMHAYERNPELVAIARAGAGVNNIPLEAVSYTHLDVYKRQVKKVGLDSCQGDSQEAAQVEKRVVP